MSENTLPQDEVLKGAADPAADAESDQADQADQVEQKKSLTPADLKDKSIPQLVAILRKRGGLKSMSSEEIEGLFQNSENLTYNGENGLGMRYYRGKKNRLELGRGGVKDGYEIRIDSDRDLAKLIKENLIAGGLEEKKPTLMERASRFTRSVRLGAKRTGRLTLRGIRDGIDHGVKRAIHKVEDKAAEVQRGVPLKDRNVGLQTGLQELDKTAAKVKTHVNDNLDLNDGLRRIDETAEKVRNQEPTTKDKIKEATRLPWKASRLARAEATKLEMKGEKLLKGIDIWLRRIPSPAQAIEAVKNKWAEITRGVPLKDRNTGIQTGLQELDKTAEKVKTRYNDNTDLKEGLRRIDATADRVKAEQNQEPTTLREKARGLLANFPWKAGRIIRGGIASAEARIGQTAEKITSPIVKLWGDLGTGAEKAVDWAKGLPERIKFAFSWENRVQKMEAFRAQMEGKLGTVGATEDQLKEYFKHFVMDFKDMDKSVAVKEIAALLLNGKVGLSGRVEKYRKDFLTSGVDLKDVGDYMEFSYEKSLRELGDQKAEGQKLTGNQRLISAKLFRFLQTVSPMSVSLDAHGERQAGYKSMKVEQQELQNLITAAEAEVTRLRAENATEESPAMQAALAEVKSLKEAQQNFESKGLSVLYTADGRTAGWYAGYALGLLLTPGASRIARLSLAAGAYGLDFAGTSARRRLETNGLLEGDNLTQEASEKFSNKALHVLMRTSALWTARNSQWNQAVRGFGGGALLANVITMFESAHHTVDSNSHHGSTETGMEDRGTDGRPVTEAPAGGTETTPGGVDQGGPTGGEGVPEVPGAETTPTVEVPTETATTRPAEFSNWWDAFRAETGSNAGANLKLMAERIANGQFNLGDSISGVSSEAMTNLQNGMQEAMQAYQQAGSMDALTPLQRLLLSASTGDADQVALAAINNNMAAIEASRIGSGGTIDWAPALEELKNMIGQ